LHRTTDATCRPDDDVLSVPCHRAIDQGFQIPAFLHMDNELVTNAMKDFCLEEGIKLVPIQVRLIAFPLVDGVSLLLVSLLLRCGSK
jgi:hypothetical protein